jgi:hypothetical protein
MEREQIEPGEAAVDPPRILLRLEQRPGARAAVVVPGDDREPAHLPEAERRYEPTRTAPRLGGPEGHSAQGCAAGHMAGSPWAALSHERRR